MRHAWRLLAGYLLLVGFFAAIVIGLSALRGDTDLGVERFVLLAPFLAAFVALQLAIQAAPPALFLAGLRDAGAAPEVTSDEIVSLSGHRRIRYRTAEGAFTVETTSQRAYALQVTRPGATEPERVRGWPRAAGRRFAAPSGA